MNDNEIQLIGGFVARAVAKGAANTIEECGVVFAIQTILQREAQDNRVSQKAADRNLGQRPVDSGQQPD